MIYLSDDGTIEVSMPDQANAEGKFTVSARQLIEGNFVVFIDLTFGTQKFMRLTYRTQDPSDKVWVVSGSPEERNSASIAVKIVSGP